MLVTFLESLATYGWTQGVEPRGLWCWSSETSLPLYNLMSCLPCLACLPAQVTHGTLSPSELDHLESQRGLLGTSGLVLLLPPRVRSNDAAEEDVYWLSALLQLKRLLQVKPFQPIVPLVVLVPSHGERVIEKVVEEGT